MTRDEIYDHLAQVYLGKSKKAENIEKKKRFNAWLLINILITVIIFTSAFYGFTAFFAHNSSLLKDNVIYSLHNGTVSLEYRFTEEYPPVKTFKLSVPKIDMSSYHNLKFEIRAREEGSPGIVKIVVRNRRNEEAAYYIQGIDLKWQKFVIPFDEFERVTDWSEITDVSFVLESWNVNNKKGLILIDGIGFSS